MAAFTVTGQFRSAVAVGLAPSIRSDPSIPPARREVIPAGSLPLERVADRVVIDGKGNTIPVRSMPPPNGRRRHDRQTPRIRPRPAGRLLNPPDIRAPLQRIEHDAIQTQNEYATRVADGTQNGPFEPMGSGKGTAHRVCRRRRWGLRYATSARVEDSAHGSGKNSQLARRNAANRCQPLVKRLRGDQSQRQHAEKQQGNFAPPEGRSSRPRNFCRRETTTRSAQATSRRAAPSAQSPGP